MVDGGKRSNLPGFIGTNENENFSSVQGLGQGIHAEANKISSHNAQQKCKKHEALESPSKLMFHFGDEVFE